MTTNIVSELELSADNIARRAYNLGKVGVSSPEMNSLIRMIEDLAYVVKAIAAEQTRRAINR